MIRSRGFTGRQQLSFTLTRMTATNAILRFRITMAFFIVGLLVSGITGFPLLAEMKVPYPNGSAL